LSKPVAGKQSNYPVTLHDSEAVSSDRVPHPGGSQMAGWELWLLAGILVLPLLLRAGWPTLTEFKFSEARLEALALEVTREGRLPLVGVPSSAGFDHSPISVYFYLPAFLLTTNPVPATVYGGLVGVAAVALCWWLARRWPGGGRWAAPVAAVLFAVSPWSVAFSRKIWQVAFVPLLALLFVGLVVSALIQGRKWNLAWALVVYALLVQVHPSAVSLSLALVLWLVIFWRRVRLGPLLAGGGGAALTMVPFLVHQVQNGWPAMAALTSMPEAVWDLTSVRLAWEAITGRGIHALAGDAYPLLRVVPHLGWFFNVVGWLALAAAAWLGWRVVTRWKAEDKGVRQTASVDMVLLTWFLVPILFNLRHSLDLYLHFFALVLPAAFLLVGRAAQDLLEIHPARWLKVAWTVGLGLVAAGQVAALVMMAGFVSNHDTPGGFGTPLGRYLDVASQALAVAQETEAAEILVVGPGNSVVVDELPAIFDVLLRGRMAYRFVDGDSTAVFPPHRAVALLSPDAGEAVDWYAGWSSRDLPNGYELVDLDGSWPQEGLSQATGPRVFENGVEVQGYDWEEDTVPGEGGRLWLLWQVLWLSSGDSHFAVRLADDQGRIWGQRDAVGYPTSLRQKGDRIINKFDIIAADVVPPEPHWAQVGMYTYPQLVDVEVIDDAGRIVQPVVVLGPLERGP